MQSGRFLETVYLQAIPHRGEVIQGDDHRPHLPVLGEYKLLGIPALQALDESPQLARRITDCPKLIVGNFDSSVTLADTLGNTAVFDEAALGAERFGYARELEVYEGPDNVAPELADLDISPLTVDTSGGPATVTMTVHATDALSGVESVGGSFDMPNTLGNYGFAMSRVRGRAPDGEWEIEIALPRHAAPGQWKLDELHLSSRLTVAG